MSTQFDLHSHSTASDGSLSPTELIHQAHQAGVDVLALTDHDSTEGLDEARQAARGCNMGFIPGIELSVMWGGQTIHIVGLRLDEHNEALQQGLLGMRRFRDWRAEEMGRRLEQHGIHGVFEDARTRAGGSIISRTHFAQVLVERGLAKDTQQVFKRFLRSGKPGYVKGEWASLEEGMGWLLAAGAEPVLAHPARYKMTMTKLRKLTQAFIELGGVALEVVSGSHSRDDIYKIAQLCRQTKLWASVGSDYHGPHSPWIQLGRLPPLPDDCKPVWQRW